MFSKIRKKLVVALGAFVVALCAVGVQLWNNNLHDNKPVISVSAQDVALNIESNNLSYGDSTFILYAVSNLGFDRDQFPISMLFWNQPQKSLNDYTLGSENYSTAPVRTVTLNDKDCLVFYSKGFAAKNIVDTVYARACVEIGGQLFYSDVKKFGVIEYVYTMRENKDLSPNQEFMMDSILQYGALAQQMFNHKVDTLANAPFYKISVKNGSLDDGFDYGRYALNQNITLVADDAPENCVFSHWVNAMVQKVGETKTLTVSVSADDTFTAVYRSLGEIPLTVADFDTMNGGKTSTSYATALSSDNGWTASSAIQFGKTASNYSFLGENEVALVLNGKKSALDWIQSPVLHGGVQKISFNYALPFSDSQFSLLVEVSDSSGVVYSQTIEKTAVTQKDVGEISITLEQPLGGELAVKISNGGLSNSSSNKDRVAIWNLSVLGAERVEGNAKLDVHFLELGNYYTGDCTFIKAGDMDILIDAGSRQSSASTIANYINQYCTDGVLEYVIATHAHQDHIAGFVGSNGDGIFDLYKVGTLIDFARTDATTQIYNSYVAKRSALIADGTKHYTALEWWNGVDGLERSILLDSGIFMTVLYQDYYEMQSSEENNYSVCLMLSQGDNHYLFTGDLESAGEQSLVQKNNLPKVQVYKAGHHGSKTSSSSALLSVIQPDIICVCCCCGSDEYSTLVNSQYPMQETVERWAQFTDQIYVTSLAVNDSSGKTVGVTSMNGNILLSSYGAEITVSCSNGNTVLKDSEWFKANRVWPSNGVNGGSGSGAESGGSGSDSVEATPASAFTYTSDGSAVTITGYVGEYADVVIPSTIDGLPVTVIGSGAFTDCHSLTSILIPNSVTSIGSCAFSFCGNLTNIVIPEGVTSIESQLFEYCYGLTSIVIPESVKNIGRDAFAYCDSLTSVTIPKGVECIGISAFSGCVGLKSIAMFNGLMSIDTYAFSGCNSLTSVVIPDSVTSIGEGAFSGCSSLVNMVIGDSVTSIGSYAFEYCTKLTSVTFENPNGWWYASSSTATSGTGIDGVALSDTKTAAQYLTDTYLYLEYYWKRS